MSISKVQGACCPVHIWSNLHEVESAALQQLKNIASLPWVFKHVAAAGGYVGNGARDLTDNV